ncbi:MAG: TorF family putative porin, partial [Steroidobacteraceae bacterium]
MARRWLCACTLALLWPARAFCQVDEPSVGGTLALTSEYIYRGVSESDGRGALQADLHVSTAGGTFAGIWASTRDRDLEPRTPGEVQVYLGQRFSLSSAWTATLTGRADYFVGATAERSNDYQELSGALTWLDCCAFSLTAIPNALRYSAYYAGYHVYRSPAVVADGAGQWLLAEGLLGGGLYATAGAGYYHSGRPDSEPPAAIDY